MSSLGGHKRLTKQAVEELRSGKHSSPIMKALPAARLEDNAVARDLIDVLILGHWLDFGQQHHFMRRFDGQSPFSAYSEGTEWIRSNAQKAARLLARRTRAAFGTASVAALKPSMRATTAVPAAAERLAVKVLRGDEDNGTPSWQVLGNALHALQDSFSPSHAIRDFGKGTPAAGVITFVKVYDGREKEGHEEGDLEWSGSGPGGFSPLGRHAIEACKALILLVIRSAADAVGSAPVALVGWDGFRDTWLRPAPGLSRSRDFAFDFIARFATSLRAGAGMLTLNMDEDGMAAALIEEVGTDMDRVHQVFSRLSEHHQTDVDDVAEIYVGLVRKQQGPVLAALGNHKALIELLIKSMDEGWTSSGERSCIDFLKTL
jgi:hypothetical protein